MFKKLLLGMIAVSAIALLWTEANAATCLRWSGRGGSQTCLSWSTGSIVFQATFKGLEQDCGATGASCDAVVSADTENSVVFCQNLTTLAIRKSPILCTQPVTFGGSGFPADGCEPQHEQDGTADNGLGHEDGHKCTSTTPIPPDNQNICSTSCTGDERVDDVVPVEMDTRVNLFVGGESLVAQAVGSSPECTGSSCYLEQHCTIEPNKIQYHKIRQYQCDITCIEESCLVVY